MKSSVTHAVSVQALRNYNMIRLYDFGSDSSFAPGFTSLHQTAHTGGAEVFNTLVEAQGDLLAIQRRGMQYEEGRVPHVDQPFVLTGYPPECYEEKQVPKSKIPPRICDAIQSEPTEWDLSAKLVIPNHEDGTRNIFLIRRNKKTKFPSFLQVTFYDMHIQDEFLAKYKDSTFSHGVKFKFKDRSDLSQEEQKAEFKFRHDLKTKFGVDVFPGGSIDIYNCDVGHFVRNNMAMATNGWGKKSVDGCLKEMTTMKQAIRLFCGNLSRFAHFWDDGVSFTEIVPQIRIEIGNKLPNDHDLANIPEENPIQSKMVERLVTKMTGKEQVQKLLRFMGSHLKSSDLSSIQYLQNIESVFKQYAPLFGGTRVGSNLQASHLKLAKTACSFLFSAFGIYTSETSRLVEVAKRNPGFMELLDPATKQNFEEPIPPHRTPNRQTCGQRNPIDHLFGHVQEVRRGREPSRLDMVIEPLVPSVLVIRRLLEEKFDNINIPPCVGTGIELMKILKSKIILLYESHYRADFVHRQAYTVISYPAPQGRGDREGNNLRDRRQARRAGNQVPPLGPAALSGK